MDSFGGHLGSKKMGFNKKNRDSAKEGGNKIRSTSAFASFQRCQKREKLRKNTKKKNRKRTSTSAFCKHQKSIGGRMKTMGGGTDNRQGPKEGRLGGTRG